MIESKKLKILQVILIISAMMTFLASHLLTSIENYVSYAYFFGFIFHISFFIDMILLLGFICLFIVIIEIIISI